LIRPLSREVAVSSRKARRESHASLRDQGKLSLERPDDGLTVGRDEENGVLLWWYAAPDTAELDDEATWRAANPASWVDLRDLRRQRNSPGTSESAFRRLHLNQWTYAEDVWITPARWAACRSEEEIPERAEVFVGVDASFSGDATAVAWSWKNEEGTILIRAHVWSALEETPAHVHVGGGHINLEAVEDFITTLAQSYRVREAVYDPAFFARSAELLSARGLTVASLDQRSAPMLPPDQWRHDCAEEPALTTDIPTDCMVGRFLIT
jgi:phage terminase large subunit-like protein